MSETLNANRRHFGNSAPAQRIRGVAAVPWSLVFSIWIHVTLGLLMLGLRSKPPIAEPPVNTVAMVFEAPVVLPSATPASKPETGTEAAQPEPAPPMAELPAPAAQADAPEPALILPPPPQSVLTPAYVPPPESTPSPPLTPPVSEPLQPARVPPLPTPAPVSTVKSIQPPAPAQAVSETAPPVATPVSPEVARLSPGRVVPQPPPPLQRPAPRQQVPAAAKPPTQRQLQRVARAEPPSRTATEQADLPAQLPPVVVQPRQQAPSSPALSAEISSGWQNSLAAWLRSHRNYPDEARRRAEEGVALVRFNVTRDGQVIAVTLVRSSGSATLDEAAQAMVRGAHLPPFPADMPQSQTTVTVPVRYRLEQ